MTLHILTHELNLTGAPRTAQEVANHMHKVGIHTKMLIVGGVGEVHSLLENDIKCDYLKCHKKGFLKTKGYIFSSIFKLAKYLITEEPSHLMCWGKEFTVVCALITKIFFLKTKIIGVNVNMIESHLKIKSKNNTTLSIKRTIYKNLLPLADKWIAQSQGLVNEMTHNYNISHENISVIYPALSPKFFEEAFVAQKKKEFVFVGRFTEQKDPMRLLNNCESFLVNNPEWSINLVSDGDLRTEMEAWIDNKNLKKQINFIGNVSNITPYVNNQTAMLLTSKFEGFGMVLAESCALGTPVISINCPSGPSEIIQSGINGYLVENDDEFKKSLEKCAANINLFDQQTIRKSVEKFHPSTVLSCYEKNLKQFMQL